MQTKPRAKTCTLDSKNGQIILITTERPAPTNPAPTTAATAAPTAVPANATNPPAGERRGGGGGGPGPLDIIVVGR